MADQNKLDPVLQAVKDKLNKDEWCAIEAYITQYTSVQGVAVGTGENFTDAEAIPRITNRRAGQKSTHCKRGHPMTEGHPNLFTKTEYGRTVRRCRACQRINERKRRAKVGKEAINEYQRLYKKRRTTAKTAFERARELAKRSK